MQKLRFWIKEPTPIDPLIASVIAEMQMVGVDSQEYPTLLAHLKRLHKMNTSERKNPVSHDTVALIVGNLLGILLIVAYEQKHVMTSQGFKELIRPK